MTYTCHRDTQQTLAILDTLDVDSSGMSQEEVAKKFGFEDSYHRGQMSMWQVWKPKIWLMFDEPYSSNAAKVSLTGRRGFPGGDVCSMITRPIDRILLV